ncbi:hypothetical protein AG1IA_10079 [Rhizoctonia solani AG-1 IA]|uniref:Uncharacterized protein n=1 Tax=Thanatephorus cucumeris (strain AG1-IA) TaxID=983506 RepID=L8WCJ9_THACA|nr:hypothetical protein AG1IA_10079 [Rhizoctonia solani AG-1 IA]
MSRTVLGRFVVFTRGHHGLITQFRETTPPQFALKIYSNALMLPTDAEPKPKASNTLLSTQLDYVDEMLDWDFASSRLMIFQGSFKKLTIAIYGQPSDAQEEPAAEESSTTYPAIEYRALPPPIDIANLSDSSQTAKTLLKANSANPPLRHVFHSLLCYVTTPEGPFDEWDESSGNPLERLGDSSIEKAPPRDRGRYCHSIYFAGERVLG